MRYLAIAVAVLTTGRPGCEELPPARLVKDEVVALKVDRLELYAAELIRRLADADITGELQCQWET